MTFCTGEPLSFSRRYLRPSQVGFLEEPRPVVTQATPSSKNRPRVAPVEARRFPSSPLKPFCLCPCERGGKDCYSSGTVYALDLAILLFGEELASLVPRASIHAIAVICPIEASQEALSHCVIHSPGSGPMWEDFLNRTNKLHHALKSTLVALAAFLDAFQRIADAATNAKGATKDVGAALTRICLRHRAVESRVKALTSALVECVVVPLQERLEEWRRSHHTLDKDHTKEYRKARTEIKKRTENAARLQKKAKKAGKNSELNKVLESTVNDLRARYGQLEEMERTAVRHALTEERARYCAFALALRPVLEEEVGLVSELGHLQEVMTQLEKHSADPHTLPPASEQASGLSEQSCGSDGSTPSPATSTATWPNLTDPTLHHKAAPPLSDRPHTISSAYEKGRDRPPLTVYTFQPPEGRSGPASPQISSQPCSPVCLELESGCVSPLVGHTATISRRSSRTSLHHNLSSSSQESLTTSGKPKPPVPNRCSSLERPAVPEKKPTIRSQQQHEEQHAHKVALQYSSGKLMPMVPDFNMAAPDMIVPQPVYSNMAELCGSNYGETVEVDGLSRTSVTSSGYGSQPHVPQQDEPPATIPEGVNSPRSGTLRRSGSHGQKPPPPVRRTPSISTITTTVPTVTTASNLNPSSSCTSLNNSPTHLTSSASNLSCCSSINGSINNGGSGSPSQGSNNGSPLQRTDSESSTPVGSLENLPPPPAFLLEDGSEDSNIVPDPDLTTPEGIRFICDPLGPPAPIQDKSIQQRSMTVSDTVKTLQESQHQPSSPVTHRRSQSLRCNQPAHKAVQLFEERRVSLEDARASLITTLNAKFAAQVSSQTQHHPKSIQKQQRTREGSQSPRMSRARLGSVQEGMAMDSPLQSPTHRQVMQTSKHQMPHQQQNLYHSTFSPPNLQPPQLQADIHQTVPQDDIVIGQSNIVINKDPNQQAFLESLNAKLSQRQQTNAEKSLTPSSGSPRLRSKRPHSAAPPPNPKPQPNGSALGAQVQRSSSGASEKASKVRQWIASKTSGNDKKSSAEVAALRESLLDQIKRGTTLKRTKQVADRSAPQVS
ncbi:protein MTSS 2 isoform X7 [Macrobrachium rosenbergii]|uniref:protein MTSS 2 isoform X7 n=1 Tax=Macrobrachium rosenbergii TaxID=79674 RepID=UPI0034D63B8B